MIVGFLFALAACFVWGLIFVIPSILVDYTPLEVVVGRYGFYGLLSVFLAFRKGFGPLRQYPLKAWAAAFIFAFISGVFYYVGIVIGIRYASAPVTVLIVGMAPIAIAFYGNWQTREVSFKSLVVPCIWMGFGMILVNAMEIDWTFSTYSIKQYFLGLTGVLAALASWSWYAVQNARFLKRHPEIHPSKWATVIGLATFFWALMLALVFGFGPIKEIDLAKLFTWSDTSLRYILGATTLGVVCSWMGCFLWNRASTHLPVSLMGPFLIFETIFGLIFVFLYEFRIPTFLEVLGVVSMLGGITLSIYLFRKERLRMSKLQPINEVIQDDH